VRSEWAGALRFVVTPPEAGVGVTRGESEGTLQLGQALMCGSVGRRMRKGSWTQVASHARVPRGRPLSAVPAHRCRRTDKAAVRHAIQTYSLDAVSTAAGLARAGLRRRPRVAAYSVAAARCQQPVTSRSGLPCGAQQSAFGSQEHPTPCWLCSAALGPWRRAAAARRRGAGGRRLDLTEPATDAGLPRRAACTQGRKP
jgi:hypothetical protein